MTHAYNGLSSYNYKSSRDRRAHERKPRPVGREWKADGGTPSQADKASYHPSVDRQVQAIERSFALLETQENDWNGYGAEAPSREAIRTGRLVLAIMEEMQVIPYRVAPSPEGGLTFSFSGDAGYAALEVYNSLEIGALVMPTGADPNVWAVDNDLEALQGAVRAIADHLDLAAATL